MGVLERWALSAVVLAVIAFGAWRLWDHHVAEPYREQGRAEMRPYVAKAVAAFNETNGYVLDLIGLLNSSSETLLDLRQRVDARVAESAKLREIQKEEAERLAKDLRAYIARPPAVPGNSCASACKTLEGPL